jgi:predicted O-methyltransferase YrrM
MKFAEIASRLEGIPHMTPAQGRIVYDFILATPTEEILELGFAHGASTCYMAAALEEKGRGRIVTLDHRKAEGEEPNIHELLERTGLAPYVEPVFANRTYLWELMKLIERRSTEGRCRPAFDFCYIDGAHTWETDGFSFHLVEKLLRSGGWVLLDDLDWSYERCRSLRGHEWVRKLTEDERTTPQMLKVFELLVCQHPAFGSFRVEDDKWGWAQKLDPSGSRSGEEQHLDAAYARRSLGDDLISLLKKLLGRLGLH